MKSKEEEGRVAEGSAFTAYILKLAQTGKSDGKKKGFFLKRRRRGGEKTSGGIAVDEGGRFSSLPRRGPLDMAGGTPSCL